MLQYVFERTQEYLNTMPKEKRKKKGQFFTGRNTAEYMAGLFDLKKCGVNVTILDPGAGTGILCTALVERILRETNVENIEVTCYENDIDVLPILDSNLSYLKEKSNGILTYKIISDDYIVSQTDDFNKSIFASCSFKYDFVISNPPYLKINRNDPAAKSMESIVHGAPNLYFLFMSMSLFNLKDDHEMVHIIPRSWTSGAYFKAFRKYLLSNGRLEYIHLFVSRDKVFNHEQVLQETIIVKVCKTQKLQENITLASSESSENFIDITLMKQKYEDVICGDDLYVFLPTNKLEVSVIQKINKYKESMPNRGYRMKTGIVVDFRQQYALRKSNEKDTIPLFYGQNIKNGRVNHEPSGKEYDWMVQDYQGLIQKNKDYVFFKRFTAKEEKRRLQCAVYRAKDFPEYEYIGTHNKINFIERNDKGEMSLAEIYGLYAIFNSTMFDIYYRILNGSTQVNSTEINNIPIPTVDKIIKMGNMLINRKDMSTECCDEILDEVAYG